MAVATIDVCAATCSSVSGPRGSFGDGRAMRTAVASKFRQSAGDGTLRIGEMRGNHPCAWHSAAATCCSCCFVGTCLPFGDWRRSPQKAGACLTLWNEVPEENWPLLLKIMATPARGAGNALAMTPRRLPSFSQLWLAMGQPEPFFCDGPARAVFGPEFASIWRIRCSSRQGATARWRPANRAFGIMESIVAGFLERLLFLQLPGGALTAGFAALRPEAPVY